ncbi:MAG: ABC transporter transmembrane domain-containing protein, partial [Paracoccaceae bacterium]|nr:ABC transporter transmembrane domain-containing protein [Paracoccaceae bacterium]
MKMIDLRAGKDELRAARGDSRGLYLSVFVFSLFVNLLMLTGPLYMLQVYDRVLGSRSEETLIALSALVVFLFAAMGFLDHARGRVMARVGARFQDRLDRRVFQAALRHLTLQPDDPGARAAQHDLEAVQRLLGSPVLIALFDLPWTPLFIIAIFVFHPVLGWLAVGGGAVLIGITLFNQSASRGPMRRFNLAARQADRVGESLRSESETVQALGLLGAGFTRWQAARAVALSAYMTASDRTGLFSVISRTLRLFLQSAMLGAGALLVLRGDLGAGAMIAGSILLGRALAPIEMIIGQWAVVLRAQEGWTRLAALLSTQPATAPRTALPRPGAVLNVHALTVAPPGAPLPVLHRISFQVVPGQ